MRCWLTLAVVLLVQTNILAHAEEKPLPARARDGLHKAVGFFTQEVATEGGYLWRYSEDLKAREGEGKASATTVWVQPPGTPSVGLALLEVYRETGGAACLEAAKKAGYCLVRGQLRSGGWDYRIEFNPKERKRYTYRVDSPAEGKSQRDTTTLDDNNTQAALRLLMRLDQTLHFKDAQIKEAAEYGLSAVLNAQYPNGAWPQRFQQPPDPAKFPVKKASYPESWSRTFPRVDYRAYYTFNDHAMSDVLSLMFEAGRIYEDPRYRKAAERCGDFILLAQMPEPQPAWAQQYDADMHPAWARKFEPPAVTGGESQGVLQTLLDLYRETGDKKYLEPIPSALAYLRRSLLPDGQLARFYELQTNRPLYFTTRYELTYRDDDLPTHYSFKVGQNLDRIEREYQKLLALAPKQLGQRPVKRRTKPSQALITRVEGVLSALDGRGRWVEDGRLKYQGPEDPPRRIIDCQTFIRNVSLLGEYLAAVAEQ
ncbi:MAG: pectate lyase [Thermoguttaceae bacterium]